MAITAVGRLTAAVVTRKILVDTPTSASNSYCPHSLPSQPRILRIIFTVISVLFVIASRGRLPVVSGFNIDTDVPIVKSGPTGSYFGFSVSQHMIWNRRKGSSETVLLVGAPKDNITERSALQEVKDIIRPGAVYRCPITSANDDCKQIKLNHDVKPRATEDKNDQWMGVSVASQGTQMGGAVACAHRYKKQGVSFRWGLGWCISMTNQLDEDRYWEPCDGKSTYFGHSQYGFCQAGTSAAIGLDGELALGAPGPYNWRGALFSNVLNDNASVFQTWQQSPVEDPVDGPPPATGYYSYLGMSVKIGNVLDGRKTYIAGAPRSKDTGQVLMFLMNGEALSIDPQHYLTGDNFGSGFGYDLAIGDFNNDGLQDLVVGAPFYHAPSTGGAIYLYLNSKNIDIIFDFRSSSQQRSAYSTVTTTDSVAVGINSGTQPIKITSRRMKDTECLELNCHDGWFGFSLSVIGDVNLDGFKDLAVGAPFEGQGAVYIFHGSRSGLVRDFSQRIYAANLPPPTPSAPIRSFGYSLSGGMDLDSNGYPDLLVGVYRSDKIFALRTRPVVDIDVVIQHLPSQIDPKITQCSKDGRKNNCFELMICFSFSIKPVERFTEKLDIDLTLEAEKFTGTQFVRVQFRDSPDSYQLNRTLQLNEQSSAQPKCLSTVVYIVKNNKDFLNSIKFLLTYKLADVDRPTMTRGAPIPNINRYPVLNGASPQTLSGLLHSVDFIKDCGDDLQCESNLKVQGQLQFKQDETGQYVWRLGQSQEMTLFVMIGNRLEDAHEATLTVTLPEYVEYRGTDQEGKQYSCIPVENVVICYVGNPLQHNQKASFGIRLDMSKVDASVDRFDIELRVNTTSNEVDDQDDKDTLNVKVITETDLSIRGTSDPVEVIYSGKIVGESGMKYMDDIGIPVTHNYEIKNVGHGPIAGVTVSVSWPFEVEMGYPKGKHLLYMTDPPRIDVSGRCDLNLSRINPLKLQRRAIDLSNNIPLAVRPIEASELRREKRESQESAPEVMPLSPATAEARTSEEGSRIIKLDCDTGSAKCFHFDCFIDNIKAGDSAVISLSARLWNSTFLEDFTHVEQVHIFSKMQLKVKQSVNVVLLNTNNDVDKARTIARPGIHLQEVPPVPLWVIIAAVCAGVVLLVLLVWILWFIGFFRRKRHANMGQYKAKVEKQKYDDDLEYSSLTLPRRL